ncbi:hypothetical protein BG004_006462 [Podila humilis]|nr:hypothetical protein BG004_006462 [Podila humilis]
MTDKCPVYLFNPFCLQIEEMHDHTDAQPSTTAKPQPNLGDAVGDRIVVTTRPASSPTIAGSTIVVAGTISVATVTVVESESHQERVLKPSGHIDHGDTLHDSATQPAQPRAQASSSEFPSNDGHQQPVMATPPAAPPVAATPSPPPERHIPSYEQWRKQALEKKTKPAASQERKQRKRKPYQESPVDEAIGGEDELGFVFPNLDSGNNGKSADNRFQQLSDQLGYRPDIKKGPSADQEWMKSEYAKDPRDRFNHASAICAASIVKASKDATHITAILNEGKDNYMLNKCSTKEKFFVVELCEEILVDSFTLGNYEFFSSTFKDFVVSVNRYPPRDDGWSVLGHFQARNTRDAQVFKPAAPQLATYIRFDFLNHYGNEYYCPVTILRVYGATALEQLKQEEEEEKRVAMEEKRRAELEKARLAAEEAEDAEDGDDEDIEIQETNPGSKDSNQPPSQEASPNPIEMVVELGEDHLDVEKHVPSATEAELVDTPQNDNAAHSETATGDQQPSVPSTELDDRSHLPIDNDLWSTLPETPNSEHMTDIPVWSEETTDTTTTTEQTLPVVSPLPSGTSTDMDSITMPADQATSEVLPPLPSTTPAYMQDDNDWRNEDPGIISLSQRTRPTHLSKPSGGSKGSASGLGTTGGTLTTESTSSHPLPSPGHSSQESVYKNIVNRLKVLELNSSLSYLYLEEQSNIFNEVIESSTQKINQLVNHLNDANRRMEVLGRKYDQLSYSYRSHVEIDGEKRRKEFLYLSNQVHVLGSQRQLFLIAAITIISVFAFFTITNSSSMHYAIQQSPLGAKLRAISGQRRRVGQNDFSGTVRIGSLEGLSSFEQASSRHRQHQQHNIYVSPEHSVLSDEDIKCTPPLSPMIPLTLDSNNSDSRHLNDVRQELGPDSTKQAAVSLRGDTGDETSAFKPSPTKLRVSNTETTQKVEVDTPELIQGGSRSTQSEHFQPTRTPYPTPKHSYTGNGRHFLNPGVQQQYPHQIQISQSASSSHDPLDYRPDSPVFQGPSSSHDAGQLSDADVAYMSRDMNVGRTSSSGGLLSSTPSMKRLSVSYYNQFHHSSNGARPSSSLRMDTTSSMTSRQDSDSPDRLGRTPDSIEHPSLHASPEQTDLLTKDDHQKPVSVDRCPSQDHQVDVARVLSPGQELPSKMDKVYQKIEEDTGFVSDSVLDSEGLASSRDVILGDWDRQHGIGEATVSVTATNGAGSLDESDAEGNHVQRPAESVIELPSARTITTSTTTTKARPKLGREGSEVSRRRDSSNIQKALDHASTATQINNQNSSSALSFGVGLGLDMNIEDMTTAASAAADSTTSHVITVRRVDNDKEDDARYYDGDRDDYIDTTSGVIPTSNLSSTVATAGSMNSRTLKKKRSKKLLEDQVVPRRKVSNNRRGSHESNSVSNGADTAESGNVVYELDKGQEGDDEGSPQVSRKSG